jgi:hypothetical protein
MSRQSQNGGRIVVVVGEIATFRGIVSGVIRFPVDYPVPSHETAVKRNNRLQQS